MTSDREALAAQCERRLNQLATIGVRAAETSHTAYVQIRGIKVVHGGKTFEWEGPDGTRRVLQDVAAAAEVLAEDIITNDQRFREAAAFPEATVNPAVVTSTRPKRPARARPSSPDLEMLPVPHCPLCQNPTCNCLAGKCQRPRPHPAGTSCFP